MSLKNGGFHGCAAAVIGGVVVLRAAGSASAAIIASGEVSPAPVIDSNGNGTWSGPGSSNGHIGNNGAGSLRVDGGSVCQQLADTSFFSTFFRTLYVGDNTGGSGSLVVDGPGSLMDLVPAQFGNGGTLYIGSRGTGSATVTNSGTLKAGRTYVGDRSGSQGTLIVDNASANLGDLFTVGDHGNGSAIFRNGADITGDAFGMNLSVGQQTGSQGMVSVLSGAAILLDDLSIGGNRFNAAGSAGTGTVLIDGTNSRITVEDELRMGFQNGTATLTIQNGGTLDSIPFFSDARLGVGGTATATITGSGSLWESDDSILVGYSSNATVTVADGGTLRTDALVLGRDAGGHGTVTIRDPGSTLDLGPGDSFYTHHAIGREGVGLLRLEGGTANFDDDLVVADLAGSTGTIELVGGTLNLGGRDLVEGVGNATFTFTDGTLQHVDEFNVGSGLHQQGGTLEVGDGPGLRDTMTIRGDYDLDAAAILVLDIFNFDNPRNDPSSDPSYQDLDFVEIEDDAVLDGWIDINFAPGFSPADGASFDVLSARTITGIDQDTFARLGTPSVSWEIVDAGDLEILRIVIPEPASGLVVSTLVIGLMSGRRRAVGHRSINVL
ncbi:MAG: hypothetical protein AAF086_09300 [Planctomycetota bacterium]